MQHTILYIIDYGVSCSSDRPRLLHYRRVTRMRTRGRYGKSVRNAWAWRTSIQMSMATSALLGSQLVQPLMKEWTCWTISGKPECLQLLAKEMLLLGRELWLMMRNPWQRDRSRQVDWAAVGMRNQPKKAELLPLAAAKLLLRLWFEVWTAVTHCCLRLNRTLLCLERMTQWMQSPLLPSPNSLTKLSPSWPPSQLICWLKDGKQDNLKTGVLLLWKEWNLWQAPFNCRRLWRFACKQNPELRTGGVTGTKDR